MEDQPLVIHRRQRNCETQQIAMDRVNAERRQAAEKRRQEREEIRKARQASKIKAEPATNGVDAAAFADWAKAMQAAQVSPFTSFVTLTSGTANATPLPYVSGPTTGTISGYYTPDPSATWSVTINGEPVSLGTGWTSTFTYES